jgi:hypothetical protein
MADDSEVRGTTGKPRRQRGISLSTDSGTTALGPGEVFRSSYREVDLCFVFDTTGSMSNKINGLIECMVDLVGELEKFHLDWRISVLPFGDLEIPGDRIVADRPFVSERTAAERELRAMVRNSGGGNEGESSIEAMNEALKKPYRPKAVKLIVLLTDEPALGASKKAKELELELRRAEVIVFVFALNLPYYRTWAEETGGSWVQIASEVDRSAILTMMRQLASDLARVAHEVHALAGGSVTRYRELGRGKE